MMNSFDYFYFFETTPRLYRDLLASLMDLTSGSGDKGTPIILVQNYFTTKFLC